MGFITLIHHHLGAYWIWIFFHASNKQIQVIKGESRKSMFSIATKMGQKTTRSYKNYKTFGLNFMVCHQSHTRELKSGWMGKPTICKC